MTDLLDGVPPLRAFDGGTYSAEQDYERLSGQLRRVYEAMRDGSWHCLSSLAKSCGCSEASASARIRDLRKSRFGSHRIERRRAGGGLFVYRMCDQKLQEAA